eukprot:GHVN01008935.1.p1 GENE.GHVN01008935.1~~GHVN01008935.1.p1  ORF type:complete len:545 (+),score=53.16 GHVN01008935.1:321-1955(+)
MAPSPVHKDMEGAKKIVDVTPASFNADSHRCYKTFFEDPGQFERIHVHIVGINPRTVDGGEAQGIRKLFALRLIDRAADPYLIIETIGGDGKAVGDTGMTDYFQINRIKSGVLYNTLHPVWDEKHVVISKKNNDGKIRFVMMDKNAVTADEELHRFELPRSEITNEYGGKEREYVLPTPASGRLKGVEFVVRIKLTDGAQKFVSKEKFDAFFENSQTLSYTEETITDEGTGRIEDNSLLQCWRRKGADKAVLWILGRNDCFMHPHVATPLFFDQGYDLYVLNYRMNGICREKGFFTNPFLNSHNRAGSFDVYHNEISKAIDIMKAQNKYQSVLGYAHSTGGPILLDYLIDRGDKDFNGFIFNSPFMDWGHVGGSFIEWILEHLKIMKPMKALGFDIVEKMMGAAVQPQGMEDLVYMNEKIVMSDWSLRTYSQYYFPLERRPFYCVPLTGGFVIGVENVHNKVTKMKKLKRAITSKPFIVISSRADDVLKEVETMTEVDWIGPSRIEVELKNNAHDVFLSVDEVDTTLAMEMVRSWMRANDFGAA